MMNTTELLEKYTSVFTEALKEARECLNKAEAFYEEALRKSKKARMALDTIENKLLHSKSPLPQDLNTHEKCEEYFCLTVKELKEASDELVSARILFDSINNFVQSKLDWLNEQQKRKQKEG